MQNLNKITKEKKKKSKKCLFLNMAWVSKKLGVSVYIRQTLTLKKGHFVIEFTITVSKYVSKKESKN